MQKALIEAPLSAGLNQKADYRDVAIDGAIVMQNCVRTKQGDIRKRFGTVQLSQNVERLLPLTGVTQQYSEFQAVRGINYHGSSMVCDGLALSAFSETEGVWVYSDAVPEAVAGDRFNLAGGGVAAGAGMTDVDYWPQGKLYVAAYLYIPATTISAGNPAQVVTLIVEENTGNIIQPPFIPFTAVGLPIPKIAVIGSTAIIIYPFVSGTQNLVARTLDLTNIQAGWSAQTTLATSIVGAFPGQPWDIMPINGDSTRFALGYFTQPGAVNTANVTIFSVAGLTSLHTFSAATAGNTGLPFSISVYATNNEWALVAFSSNNAGVITFQAMGLALPGFGATFGPFTVAAVTPTTVLAEAAFVNVIRINATNFEVFWHNFDNSSGPPPFLMTFNGQQATTGGSTIGPAMRTSGVMMMGKPAVMTMPNGDQRCYIMVNTNSSLQGTQALCCFDIFGQAAMGLGGVAPLRLVSVVAPRLAKTIGLSSGSGTGGVLVTGRLVNTGTSLAAPIYINTSSQTTFSTNTATFLQKFDFASPVRYFGDVLAGGNMLGLSAGAPFRWEGNSTAEDGFLYYPEAISFTTTAGAGYPAGTYQYIIVYEWIDASGNIDRSATSPPLVVTLGAAVASVNLTLPTMGITYRQRGNFLAIGANQFYQNQASTVRIAVYRTAQNGTTYYLLGQVDNSMTASSVAFVDGNSVTNLTSQQLVYTTGGILDNLMPPSARIRIVHKNRWVLGGCDDPTAIWASKEITPGEVPGFNEGMTIYATGSVLGLASLDEKLVIFVKRGAQYGIEYVTGQGPFDTGAGYDWTTPPQGIPASVGALDQRSIAVTEAGIFFYSPVGAPNDGGGIFLLSRDLQVQYLSGAVEDVVTANPICTAAVVHPNAGRIYFEMTSAQPLTSSTTGVRLVYDYIMQCWSTDTHYSFVAAADGLAAATSWVAGGKPLNPPGLIHGQPNAPVVYWADYAGSVYRETNGQGATAWFDISNLAALRWVTATFTSAWYKPTLAGFARFWRIQLQSDVLSAAQLTASFQFDYAPASNYAETMSFTDTAIAAFNRYPQCDTEHIVGNQKAKSVQVTLTDAAPIGGVSGSGQGFSWASLSLEVGVESSGRYMNVPGGQRG